MEKIIFAAAVVLIAVMVLTLWVNIIVAITKKVVAWDKFPVQVWVMIVAVVSTVVAAAALAQYFGIVMLWCYWLGAGVCGVLVSGAAIVCEGNVY